MIFWAVLLSFSAAKVYDSRETKKVQQKWRDLVAHISQERLAVTQLPRKLTVFISACPGDSMGPTRQYFKDYVKPVLVAAAMDYEVIEGRKEGDVRYGTAEQIRRLRRKQGERGPSGQEPEMDAIMAVDMVREKLGVRPYDGVRGDLVLGRHTWKEYIRGIHEGWLGPLEEPSEPVQQESSPIHPPTELRTDDPAVTTNPETAQSNLDAQQAPLPPEKKEEEKEKEKETKKIYPPATYLPVTEYASAQLSPHAPQAFEPSEPIHQQHLLGFLKTPQRIYNWLNRRSLADHVGRQVASIVLAQSRPCTYNESFASTSAANLDAVPESSIATRAPESDAQEPAIAQTGQYYEQQDLLQGEEHYWHKSVRKPRKEGDTTEQIWTKSIVLDPRIATRMRRFELDPQEEARAGRIARGEEESRAVPPIDLTQDKPIIGSLDQDSMEG